MGLIPRHFLDELLQQTDIVTLIDGYIPLKKQGSSFVACCPFHQEKNPSFNVIGKKQFYHCFGCGVSGNAISFLMAYLNQNFSEAVENLAARAGVSVPREGSDKQHQLSLNLYPILAKVATFYEKNLRQKGNNAQQYLATRGVNDAMITRYQLGYAPADWHHLDNHELKSHHDELVQSGMLIKREQGGTYDRYRHRLMFPIHDRHGRIIGFGGRSLDAEQKPKYLNSPETIIFQKNRELYGLHHVLQQHTTPDLIIVVEGYLDVIALAQMGITQAVATLGTATSRFHVQLLSKHTSHVVFCFDGDSAGQKAAWRAVETIMPELSQGLNATFMFLPQQHDPDSFIREQGKDAFMHQLQNALSLNQYFFQTLLKQVDSSTLAGKNQLILAAKPHLLKLPEGPYKQLMLTELARMTHLELHRIEQLITPTSAEAPSLPIVAMAQIKRTPIRLAMALMLQNPSVYASIKDNIPSAHLPNPHTVLKKIMQEIECNPEATTASLVETFRGSKAFDALNQLAIWQHQVPSAALVDELSDTLLFLIQKNEQHQIQTLIERSRQNDLSESERLTLQTLLKRRHHVKS